MAERPVTAEALPQPGLQIAYAYQAHILPLVSRTFALTIPQLPSSLATVVSNAYLLCRIADTIEDDPNLSAADQVRYQTWFARLVTQCAPSTDFVAELLPKLSSATSAAELDLIRNTALVLRVTGELNECQRAAVGRCLEIMCMGMRRFGKVQTEPGLPSLADLNEYCYVVAGVVGELLTELFSDYSTKIGSERPRLMRLALSFGQGLQMTNIIKDIWEDMQRGFCWMPRDVFARHGFDVKLLNSAHDPAGFHTAYRELIGVAHAHLRRALAYVELLPPEEAGIRRFSAWAIGMSLLTLDKVNANPGFASAGEVKISRRAVGWTTLSSSLFPGSNRWLRILFRIAARRLPLTELPPDWDRFVPEYRGIPTET